jgi:lysophospholipase L1-like esterase
VKRFLLNAVLILFSLLLALGLTELALRWLPAGKSYTWSLHGVDPQDNTRYLPNFHVDSHSAEFDYSFTTNSHGRRDIEWSSAAIAAPDNLVFIGDSFVNGFGVSDEATMASQLEALFRARGQEVEVFNYGIGGAISIPEYRRLLEQAIDAGIQARTVLVGVFIGNDFTRGNIAVDTRLAKPEPGFSLKRLITDSRLYTLARNAVQNSPYLTGLVLRAGDWLHIPVYRSPSSYIYLHNWTDAEQAFFYDKLNGLLEMRKRCRDTGKNLHVVLIPNLIQVENYDALSGSVYEADRPNRLIMQYCNEHGLSCMDLLPVLRERRLAVGQPFYHAIDRHFNELGNAEAAAAIMAWLEDTGPHAVPDTVQSGE